MRSARGSSCRLSESNLLPPGAKFAFYRHHETDLNPVLKWMMTSCVVLLLKVFGVRWAVRVMQMSGSCSLTAQKPKMCPAAVTMKLCKL